MKFADIEVGKSYKNSNPDVKLVVFKTDKYVVVETKLPYPTVYGNSDAGYKNWVEVKKVSLYCAIWHDPKSGHSFIQQSATPDRYENLRKIYLDFGYKLIREFVEEFNVV